VPVHRLYLRLSGFYLFYFATLGVLLPYWSLYLEFLGFTPTGIGALMAITLATKVVAPNIWGWIADHTGKRMSIVRFACLATLVLFTGVYPAGSSFIGLATVMLCFSFFWNAALPQFEAITLNHLGVNAHRYSSVRLWGSVGFVAAALLVGFLVQHLTLQIVPAVLLGLFLALWVNSLLVPEERQIYKNASHDPFLWVLRRPAVVSLFVVCFLNQASHGPYYAFFSIYLEDLGYSRMSIGGFWDLGVLAEIGMFLLMPRLLLRFAARQLMLLTLAFTSLRWLLIGGFADNLILLLFAQMLHALSFGAYHVIAIHLIHRFFSGHHQGRGQALYSSLSFGAGGALGSFAAGYLWTIVGAEVTYALAAALSALGFVVAWVGLRSE